MFSTLKSAVQFLLLMSLAIGVSPGPGVCGEQYFYSIHFASSKNLVDVNKKINSLQEKGKIVFWEKTEMAGMGKFYRVYMGRYDTWDDAMVVRNKLKKAGIAGHLGIQWFADRLPSTSKSELNNQAALPPPPINRLPQSFSTEKTRFIDNQDGTVSDTKTNLMWIKNGWSFEFVSADTWPDAMDKCKAFRLAEYEDWRLPTLEEWITLIDINNKNPALVEPNPFVNIISHMPYWTQTEFTYSRDHTCNKVCPLETHTVLLFSGSIQHQKKSDRALIMPVRSIVNQTSFTNQRDINESVVFD